MRKLIVASSVAVIAVVAAENLWAQERPAGAQREARMMVRQAIQALGGRQALNKSRTMTWKETGTYYGMGDGLPYTGQYAVQWPGQFKMEIMGAFAIVIDGDKAWMSTGGSVQELTGDDLAEQKKQLHSGYVTTLLFLGEEGYRVAKLEDAEVNGKPASVVKVSKEGQRDVTLSFDKESHLPVKAEYRLQSPELGKEVTEEVWLQDYREVDGLKVPGKHLIHRDGEKFVEAQNSEIKLAERLEASVFAKPQ